MQNRFSENILIIGGCGYIGSQLFNYLQNKKYNTKTVDLEWYGNYTNNTNLKKNYRDLTKLYLNQFSTVILLAGHSNVEKCEKETVEALKNNVENFLILLKNLNSQKLISASSSSIYGNSGQKKISENFNQYVPTN